MLPTTVAFKPRCLCHLGWHRSSRSRAAIADVQAVFVSSEISPWSKAGGLGDVLEALPVALSQRIAAVMTVAPAYQSYKDCWDTGIDVPVQLPPIAALEGCGVDTVRLLCCSRRGVLHVFAQHPLFHGAGQDIYAAYTAEGGPRMVMAAMDVLCQVALAAPVLLWSHSRDGSLNASIPQEPYSSPAAVNSDTLTGGPEAETPLEGEGKGHVCADGAYHGQWQEAGANLVFVANDWPTATLPLHLRAAQRSALLPVPGPPHRQSPAWRQVHLAGSAAGLLTHQSAIQGSSETGTKAQEDYPGLCAGHICPGTAIATSEGSFAVRQARLLVHLRGLAGARWGGQNGDGHMPSTHAGLFALLALRGQRLQGAKAVLCIHNIAYQGEFEAEVAFASSTLPSDLLGGLLPSRAAAGWADALSAHRAGGLPAGWLYNDMVNDLAEKSRGGALHGVQLKTFEPGFESKGSQSDWKHEVAVDVTRAGALTPAGHSECAGKGLGVYHKHALPHWAAYPWLGVVGVLDVAGGRSNHAYCPLEGLPAAVAPCSATTAAPGRNTSCVIHRTWRWLLERNYAVPPVSLRPEAGHASDISASAVRGDVDEPMSVALMAQNDRSNVRRWARTAWAGLLCAVAVNAWRLPQLLTGAACIANCLRAGLRSASALVTVSPTYAREIQRDNTLAFGLRGEVMQHPTPITGILNGLDTHVWDPTCDAHLAQCMRFGSPADAPRGKAAAKAWVQRHVGLPLDPHVPLFIFVGRLTEQKGVDILLKALLAASGPGTMAAEHTSALPQRTATSTTFTGGPGILSSIGILNSRPAAARQRTCTVQGTGASTGRHLRWQAVLLGTGEPHLEHDLRFVQRTLHGRVAGIARFEESLAHRLMAAGDVLLVPSRFEPCGLVALAALRYGALPVVSSTGGLVDIVSGRFMLGGLPLSQEDVGEDVGYTAEEEAASVAMPGPAVDGDQFRIRPFGFEMGEVEWAHDATSVQLSVSRLALALTRVAAFVGTPVFQRMRQRALEAEVGWGLPADCWAALLADVCSMPN